MPPAASASGPTGSASQGGGALPLTGADCFLRAFESEVRRTAKSSHLSQLVLRLGPGFDLDAFRRLIAEVSAANPIVRAPIRRRRFVPVYDLDRAAAAPGIRIETHGEPAPRGDDYAAPYLGSIPGVFFERLNDRFDARRGKLLCFDVVERGGVQPGTDLAMTWQHMLFDGTGSEHFVEHLAACSLDPLHPRRIAITRAEGGASSPAAAQLPTGSGVRGRMAQAWHQYMLGLGEKPPRSLAGPLRRTRQDLRYDELRLEGQRAAEVMERAKKTAGFLTPMLFFLAAALRAHQAVADRRHASPASWIVPLPVNLRAKGGDGEVFRTHVSLLWFQVTPEETRDFATLVETLKAQRVAAIRNKLVEAGVAAMDYARYAPSRVYTYMARRTFGGELASFFFAWTAEFAPAATSLCGADILDGFHAPSVPASPGSALEFCLHGDGLDVVHVYQQGSLDNSEIALMRAQLLEDLVGA